MATVPRTPVAAEMELPNTKGHGFGWFVSLRGNTYLLWNAGEMAGHKTILVKIPQYAITIIVLTNSAEAKPNDAALAIVDRFLNQKK